eukprot:gene15115-biopygen17151
MGVLKYITTSGVLHLPALYVSVRMPNGELHAVVTGHHPGAIDRRVGIRVSIVCGRGAASGASPRMDHMPPECAQKQARARKAARAKKQAHVGIPARAGKTRALKRARGETRERNKRARGKTRTQNNKRARTNAGAWKNARAGKHAR